MQHANRTVASDDMHDLQSIAGVRQLANSVTKSDCDQRKPQVDVTKHEPVKQQIEVFVRQSSNQRTYQAVELFPFVSSHTLD